MSKFSLFSKDAYLGDVEAFSSEEALKSAKTLFPNTLNLRTEPNKDDSDAYERANPISAIEMRKALNAMIGKAKPMTGKRGG